MDLLHVAPVVVQVGVEAVKGVVGVLAPVRDVRGIEEDHPVALHLDVFSTGLGGNQGIRAFHGVDHMPY